MRRRERSRVGARHRPGGHHARTGAALPVRQLGRLLRLDLGRDVRHGIADDGGAQIVLASGTKEDGVANQDASADVCREGTGLAIPTANGDNAFERKDEGRQDTDSNLEDFAGPKVGNPQPFGSPPEPPPATPYEIWEIQGTAHRSSWSASESSTTGDRYRRALVELLRPGSDSRRGPGDLRRHPRFRRTAPVGAAVTVRGTCRSSGPVERRKT